MPETTPDPLQSASDSYCRLAERLIGGGIVSDPWLEGKPRFRTTPLLLDQATHEALQRAAEEMCAVYNEAVLLCAADSTLLDRYFGLTPFQRLMWEAAAPEWHGIARADVFLTTEGPMMCELNCDTPSGQAEAVLLNSVIAASAPGHANVSWPAPMDPCEHLIERFCDLLSHVGESVFKRMDRVKQPFTVGILYPTELTEDLSMIRLYERSCMERGWRVVLGAPFNLHAAGERGVALFDVPCDVLVRHYKTDWWGEREPAWDDEEPFADSQPLAEPLELLFRSIRLGGCAVVNPFGAVVAQNKRMMALLWEEIARFPSWARDSIRRYLPYTARLESLGVDYLKAPAQKEEWVIKSDFGCEGAEVVIGADCTQEEWEYALAHAAARRWIAQRRFRPIQDPANGEGASANYGVYLVGGVASGYLTRVQAGATDAGATTVATLVNEPRESEIHTGGIR